MLRDNRHAALFTERDDLLHARIVSLYFRVMTNFQKYIFFSENTHVLRERCCSALRVAGL